MSTTIKAEPECKNRTVVMARFNGERRTMACRMSPEMALSLSAELQSAAQNVLNYEATKATP